MKLHLPTRLRAAVLACITAVAALSGTIGTGTITTGVVAYTIAASQAEAAALVNRTFEYEGVTYSGGALVTLDVTNPANVTKGGTSHTISAVGNMTVNIGESEMTMETGTNLLNSTGKGDSGNNYTLWWDFANNKAYYGQTMRLTGAAEAWTLTFNYGPITFGGLVTEASEGGSYTIGRASSYVDFWANEDAGANMLINATTTVASNSIEVKSNGAWALNKNLTMGANTAIKSQKTITLSGTGALNVSGALTLESGAHITGENTIAVTGALVLDLAGVTAGSDALVSTTGSVTATALTLNNYQTLDAGSYKLISTTNDAATALAALFSSTEQYTVSNKSGVVTLTVKDTGIETLTEDLVAPPNFYKYCGSGLNVGEHNINATYSAAGYSALYTKGLQGSGNITFNRTNGGNNLCVLWIDGDASEYTGTISMGSLSNVFLKLGSDAAPSTDLSAATVNMTKEVIAIGGNATIGTLITDQTQIRAVDGTTSNISAMCNAASPTGMQNTTVGFAQKDDAVRSLSITSSATLTNSTINKGVNLVVANGASATLAGGTVNGTVTNNGALGISGAITLGNSIVTATGSTTTFAADTVINLSQLTKSATGVYTVLSGLGISNLATLNQSNITGVDTTGYSLVFDNNGTITFVDETSDLVWNGGNGTWDETSQNWLKNSNPSVFADADRVTFNDAAEVTLVGDLRAGGVNVNAALALGGDGTLAADAITIGETGSLAINGDATVSVDRENLNKMQVSGSGTLEINKIGTAALAFDGGEAGFSGTLALTQDVVPSGHGFTTTLTNFTGTVVIDALINHADSDFGDAAKLVFVGSRATDQIGFWCNTGINPTLTQEIEIAGDNEVRFFMNGTTLSGNITGNKLRLHSGTGTFSGTTQLNSLNLAQDNVELNLLGDTTLGTLKHDGNRTTLKVGDADHNVTLNITGTDARSFNVKSHIYEIAAGSEMNDNTRLQITNATLTLQGGGVYNLKSICSGAEANGVGNVEINENTTLHITGTAVSSDGNTGAFMLSNWPASSTYNIRGILISEAGISGRDGTGTLNVQNGGLLQLNGGFVSNTDRSNNATINVENGGTLKVASTTTAYNNQIAVKLKNGSTFEGTADNTAIAQNLTIDGSAETPATANIKADTDKSLTLSGVISGEHGALNKTGDGTLVLSGTNTYAGGTTVAAGTLEVVGSLGTGGVTVNEGGTLILHTTLDGATLANNGSLEIASGFAGLESAGSVGVEGATEGNGYTMGGSANLFTTSGTLTGTLSATFNGAAVTIAEDGSFELDTDWSTYRVKSARSETETIAAIKALAVAHDSSLKNLVFSDGVDAAMETMDVDGFNVELGNSAQTIGTLNITNGTVTSTCNGDDGVAFTTGAVNINAGGKLVLTGSDAFSWCSSPADSPVILLAGAEGNMAVLQLDQRATYGKGEGENGSVISLNGYSRVTGEGGLDPLGNMNNPATVNVAAGTTNNVIDATMYKRSVLVFNVGEGADLTIASSFVDSPSGNTEVGHVTKAGAGTATITKDNTFYGLNLKEGTLVIDAADVLVTRTGASGGNGAEFNLWEQGTATGVLKLVNEANLKVDTNSNMWFHDGTSVLIEKGSSFTKLASDYSMEILAAGETEAKMIAKSGASWYYNNLTSDIFYVEDAAVSISSTADSDVGLKMNAASTFTNAGAGKLTLSHAETTALAGLNAKGGNIGLGSVTSVGTLDIAAGKTVSSDNALTVTTGLTAGSGATLSTALTLNSGAALDLVTGTGALSLGNHEVTLGTGLVITEALKSAITALEAETSLTLMQGVTELTGGSLDATTVFTGLTGDYLLTVEEGNLIVSAAALPTAELTWEGGDGTWGDGTPWTKEGGESAYIEGANVTINGTTGGTITVSGEQAAKSVTFASNGYDIARGTNADTLTIAGNLTINENVSAALGFLPTVSGSIVVNEGATLDLTGAGLNQEVLYAAFDKGTGAGTIVLAGGSGCEIRKNLTASVDITVDGTLWLNGKGTNSTITIGEGKTLTLVGNLNMGYGANITVAGGTLDAQDGISIGHTGGNYPATLTMTSGEIKTTAFTPHLDNNTNTINITGGKLTITGAEAFTKTGASTTVTIGAATITNGTTDMAFNHASTLTGATITAQDGTTITVGGTGMTTTLVGAITTQGNVAFAGMLDTTGLTGVTNSGNLTINAESVSLAGLNNTGTVTVTNGEDKGNITLTTATTAGGELSAADVTLTGANTFSKLTATGTVTSADTLTVGAGSDMAAVSEGTKLATTGDVSIGSDASLAALSNAGNTLTVDGALTLTAATTAGGSVAADSLSLTGANTFEAITLNEGGALTLAGSVNITGALTADTVNITNLSLTTTALTAGSVAGGTLAITADQAAIATLMGTDHSTLTLANVTGLTGATINGESGFSVGARDYTIGVTDGLVQITATISNQLVWDAEAEGATWGDGSSWQGDVQPTEESNVVFNGTGIANVTIAGNAVANDIFVGSDTNFIADAASNINAGALEISGGTLTIGDNVSVDIYGGPEEPGTASVLSAGELVIKGQLTTDVLAADNKTVQLGGANAELMVVKEGVIKSIDGIDMGEGNKVYGKLIVGTHAKTMVQDTLTITDDSTVQELDVRGAGTLVVNPGKNLTILGDVANAGAISVGGDLTQGTAETDTFTSDGTLSVGGNFAGQDVTLNGNANITGDASADKLTIGSDSMTAIGGAAEVTDALVNAGSLAITGDTTAQSVTTQAGAETTIGDASHASTLEVGTTLDNYGTTDVKGSVSAQALTTATGATTTIGGDAELSDALTNEGATTIEGALTSPQAAVQNNVGTLSVEGNASADTLATAAGATTTIGTDETAATVTIGTSLTNAGSTTIKGNVVSADTTIVAPGSADITNSATGAGEKLAITGDVSANTLTTETGATTEIGGAAKLTDDLVNHGTTTITGALTTTDDVVNTGTLAMGSLTADKLDTTGAVTVTGDATVNTLAVSPTGSLTATGTVKTDAAEGTLSSVQADTLDLTGLTAAATIANLKADKITLSDFGMLTVTDSLSNETATGDALVDLTLTNAAMSALSVGDEKVIIAGVSDWQLNNLEAVNASLKTFGLKGVVTLDGTGQVVLKMEDNSFLSQLGTTENGKAGLEMADEVSAEGVAPTSDMAQILKQLDTYRTDENADAGDKLGAALSGSSIAAMGAALSGDVDRQLRAIRNRTTSMGVNQGVVNEDMPYLNAWVNAEGDYRTMSADGTLAGYKMMSWGGTVGFDVDCTPSFTCGLAATAMYGSFDAESEDSATGDLDTYYVSAFARYAKHRWTHTFVATAGMADTSLSRTVEGVKVEGDSDGMVFGGMYEVGYVFALDEDATTCLQPVLNVSYTHTTLNGYDESGSDIALSSGEVEMSKLTVGAGARLQSVIGENIYNRSSLFEARALVKFDAGDRQAEVSNKFADYASTARTLKSAEMGAIGGEFGMGVTVPVGGEGGNVFMDASAEIRASYTNVNATVGYRVNF